MLYLLLTSSLLVSIVLSCVVFSSKSITKPIAIMGVSVESDDWDLLDFQRCSCDSATFCLNDADIIKINMIYASRKR